MNQINDFWRLLTKSERSKISLITAFQIILSCFDWLLYLLLYLIISKLTGAQLKFPTSSVTESLLTFVDSKIEKSALAFYSLLLLAILSRIALNLVLQFNLMKIFNQAQRRISQDILAEISISSNVSKETKTLQEISFAMTNAVDAAILITLGSTISLIVDSVLLILLLIPVIIYSPFVLIILLVVAIAVSLYFQRYISRSAKKLSAEETSSYLELMNFIADYFSVLKETRLAGKVANFLHEFDKIRGVNSSKVTGRNYIQLLPKYFLEGVIALLLVGFAIVSTLSNMKPNEVVTLSTFLIFIAIRIFPILLRVQAAVTNIESWHSISSLILETSYFAKHSKSKRKSLINHLTGKSESTVSFDEDKSQRNPLIKLSNLSFKYKSNSPLILDAVCIEIFKGDFIGIVGPSGSGKSTFIDLLCGFLVPTSGSIEICGKSIEDYVESNPGAIAVVPQDVEIFQGSVAENISLLPGISEEAQLKKISELLSLVGLNGIGNEKLIGPAIGRLSGGEKQRLGLARALFGNPTLLIFDEATSSLDQESQIRITEILNGLKGTITILAIAHRRETIAAADKVLEIVGGGFSLE